MEQLFMQLFERGDWLAAQVEQQADSYRQTLACSILAAGHRPPDWLLPPCAGKLPELNGKSIVPDLVFPGSRITTPAANRTVFLPQAAPSTSFRTSEVPNEYTLPDTNYATMDTVQHEEPQQEQTSLSQELAKTCAEASMFSRIQRSKSRQRYIEDRQNVRDQAASGSCDDMQDGMHMSKLVAVGSDRASSPSIPCGDVANNADTTSSCPDQENGFYASQGRSTDFVKCQSDLGNQRVQLDASQSLDLESKLVCADGDAKVGNNCSVGDLPNVPLPDHSGLNIADSVPHIVPETHLLVEPKKLQFDGAESVCIDAANEQTWQQHGSALKSNHLDRDDKIPFSEEPYPTSSSQEPHSVGSSMLDGSIAGANTPLGHPSAGMQNEMLKGNPASGLVNCHSGKLGDDVQVHKAYDGSVDNKKSESAAPEVISRISSGRTRDMSGTERNYVASSGKCNGSLLLEGTEQENPSVEAAAPITADACNAENVERVKASWSSVQYLLGSSVSCEKNNDQLKEDIGNAQKRSIADGVQANESTSSKRRRIKCQDITLSSSSHTNLLSLNQQDGIGSNVVTAENFSGRSQPSGRYLLRSSGFCETMSLKSETKNAATNNKMSGESDVQENGDSSPKLTNSASLSNVALCESSSGKASLPTLNCYNSSKCSMEGTDFQNSEAHLQNNSDIVTTSALPSCSKNAPDSEECIQEENNCLEGQGLSLTISSVEKQKTALQMDEKSFQSVILNPEIFSSTGSLTMFPSYALDEQGKHASDPVASVHEKLSYGSSVELDTKYESEDPIGFLLSDATIPRQVGDEFVDCNDTMPEFECFVDSPTTEKVTVEALSAISNKANTVSGMKQRVATMSGKATNYSFHDDLRQYSASDDDSIMDIFGSCGLGISGSFSSSDALASCSSNACNKEENGENPLTPAVQKYSLGKLSARAGSGTEHMGSIPELSCFRIDEDSGIGEENEYQDKLPESVGNQRQSGRKALNDITGLCQNAENSALCSLGILDTGNIDLTTETCSSEFNHHAELTDNCDNMKSKENCAPLVKREGKMSHSLHNRLSKTEVIHNRIQRNTSEANLRKRSKPSNIVANVASFIPLVKPKLQSTTACLKKDVRVKALEAAEAAKRLEEKKQNEREMRKAAAKLEREKLKQEKELKQKQEQEHKKKLDTDVAARKRQRDEDERREKERKRKCAEETRKQQKQPMDRRHANDEKDAHPKASNNKELRKNLSEVVKSQVKPYETTDLGNNAIKSNNEKVMLVDERPASSQFHVKENIPNNPEESYMMSPYKDSDEEDDEHEEQSRRKRKLIPSWADLAERELG
ncbi:hypothetical protein ACP70R_007024 [Stipagrostis hirtigluma subsp. patula]